MNKNDQRFDATLNYQRFDAMLSAAQAREKANSRVLDTVAEVLNMVETEAESGAFDLTLTKDMTEGTISSDQGIRERVVRKLEELGYIVSLNNDQLFVSWNE